MDNFIYGEVLAFNTSLNKNIAYLFLVQGSSYLLPLITFPYLVRVLGPEFFGVLGFCQASMQYLVMLTEYGFNWTATQKVAINKNDRNKLTHIFWSVIFAKILLSILAFIVLIPICIFIERYREVALILAAFSPLVFGNVIYPIWFFQGLEKMKWISLCTITARAMLIPLTFIFVKSPVDVWIAALIQGTVNLFAGCISLYIIKRNKWVGRVVFSAKDIKENLVDGWHVFISTSAISLYTTSTTVILGFVSGPIAVGYFNAANTIRNAAQGLLNPITQAIYPRINSLLDTNYSQALNLIKKSLRYIGALSLLGSSFLCLLAPYIISLTVGDKYLYSVDVLRWMAFLPFVLVLSNIFGVQTMLTHNYKKEFSYILVLSGVLNLSIIFPLVYKYSAIGAAISIFITESFVALAMYLFLQIKKIYI
ncbi:flippase, partial [Escherichia albertii]|uniref:flippase n=1 Tax=Escherichia albertii TaxID=208962 RepID=UPI0037ADAE02